MESTTKTSLALPFVFVFSGSRPCSIQLITSLQALSLACLDSRSKILNTGTVPETWDSAKNLKIPELSQDSRSLGKSQCPGTVPGPWDFAKNLMIPELSHDFPGTLRSLMKKNIILEHIGTLVQGLFQDLGTLTKTSRSWDCARTLRSLTKTNFILEQVGKVL